MFFHYLEPLPAGPSPICAVSPLNRDDILVVDVADVTCDWCLRELGEKDSTD